jgi:GGDEF domain-containing protein
LGGGQRARPAPRQEHGGQRGQEHDAGAHTGQRKELAAQLSKVAADAAAAGARDAMQAMRAQVQGVRIEMGKSEEEKLVAMAAAEALRHDLVNRPIECEGKRLTVTASMGLGAFDATLHGDGDGLYRAVDLALYAAKGQGRNRVQPVAAAPA